MTLDEIFKKYYNERDSERLIRRKSDNENHWKVKWLKELKPFGNERCQKKVIDDLNADDWALVEDLK